MATETQKPQTAAENPKIVAPKGTIPTAAQADGPSLPHPSEDKPDPVLDDDALNDAKARALAPEDDEDVDIESIGNLGEPVGPKIKTIVRKKFYSEEGRVEEPGKVYYFQLREGQTFPSDVLEPVDVKTANKFRKAFRAKQDDRREREVLKAERREEILGVARAVN